MSTLVGTLQPLWTSFRLDLRSAGKAPKTIKIYQASMNFLTEFLGKDLESQTSRTSTERT